MATKRWEFLTELESRLSLIRVTNGYNTDLGKFIHHGKTMVLEDGSVYEVPISVTDYNDYPYIKVSMLDGETTHTGRQGPFHIEMNLEVTGVIWAVDNEPLKLEQIHEDLENGIQFDKLFSPGVQVRYASFKYNAREVGEHQGSVTIVVVARVPHCFEYPTTN